MHNNSRSTSVCILLTEGDFRHLSFSFSTISSFIVISAKQLDATDMNMSSLESEVFPTVEESVNYTSQLNAAQIIIPAQVLLEALTSEGNFPTTDGLQFHELKDESLETMLSINLRA